jgi:hypothetical protein
MREIDIRVWCKSCKGIDSRNPRCNECKGEGLVWPEWEQLEFLFPEEKSNESKKGSNGGYR